MKLLLFCSTLFLASLPSLKGQVITTFRPQDPGVNVNILRNYFVADGLVSNPTLNVFFATKVSTYLSESSDLSLSKAYAVLDNSDGRLFLGGTFNARKSNTEFKKTLFTLGVKANVKDGFATLFSGSEINNDIGLSAKLTIFGNGSIRFFKKYEIQKAAVANKRLLLANELLRKFEEELGQTRLTFSGSADSADAVTEYIADYTEEIREEFAKREAEFVIKKSLYNYSHDWWVGFDAYIPVTKSSYDIVKSLSNPLLVSENYRPYEFNVSYTNFWEKNKTSRNPFLLRGTTLLTFKGSVVANNSASASLIDSYSFDNFQSVSQNLVDTLVKLKSKNVFVGDFEKFVTPKISARYVYMPLPYIGVSAAIEKTFGKINDLNWRLGIPISLKDNEGKAKVNFEVVWREISKSHSIGLSVGLPIGNNIF